MEVVALEMIKALQKLDKSNEYVVFVKEDEDNLCLKETSNFEIKVLKSQPYPIWEQISLPKEAKKHGIDFLHCTANTGPIYFNGPVILTLHDIIYLESISFSGSSYQNFGNLYRRFVVPKLVKKSKYIITVSQFEQQRISEHLKLDKNKTTAVYNGKSEVFRVCEDNAKKNEIKAKYNLPDNFILFFGNTAPKKNTSGVLAAYIEYCSKMSDPLELVITDCTPQLIETLVKKVDPKSANVLHKIRILDYVNFTDVPILYNLSDLFLYPSFRESFGLPIIEAMACGTPVITSDTSSMPEVSGEAAVLVDPKKPSEIAKSMVDVLSNSNLRNELVEKGLDRAKAFNWESTAQQTQELYKSMIN